MGGHPCREKVSGSILGTAASRQAINLTNSEKIRDIYSLNFKNQTLITASVRIAMQFKVVVKSSKF